MGYSCNVCSSPVATTLHFGGRTCKACAAFFRRTVSARLEDSYKCRGNGHPCRIHYELRMICRLCRFHKCLAAGMKKELVQARGEQRQSPKIRNDFESTDYKLIFPNPPEIDWPASTSSSGSPTEPSPEPNFGIEFTDKNVYMRIEEALNARRRIMYTDATISEVFKDTCDCPYAREQLREFDHNAWKGYQRPDFIMMYDYASSMPGFDKLSHREKRIMYRFSCAVDCQISCAYYTWRLGQNEQLLVLFNGEFIRMDPLPMSGLENDAEDRIANKESLEKYRTLMPTKLRQWELMAVPFAKLQITFQEYCLMKALTIWQMTSFFLEQKEVYKAQRDEIILALQRLALERGLDPAIRLGELTLNLSSVMEQVQELIRSVYIITVFDVLDWDEKIKDILAMPYNFDQ